MKIRTDPIEVPKKGDAFLNDRLERREQIHALTQAIRAIEGPCVLAVDGEWGAGKTSFLKLWNQHLRVSEEFQVVYYNAWRTDYAMHPLVPLIDEIERMPRTESRSKITQLRDRIRVWFLSRTAKKLSRILACLPGWPGEIVRLIMMRTPRSAYRQTTKQIERLKKRITKITNDRQKLIVFVDELDRCRPSYALEFLEVSKHIFDIDNVIFVLAVNQAQVECAVRALYGADLDSSRYLRRFFDHTISLGRPDRAGFIADQLKTAGLTDYFCNGHRGKETNSWLLSYWKTADVSLRDIAQMARHCGLVLSSLPEHRSLFSTVVAVIVKAVAPDVYRRIIGAEITDDEAYGMLRDHSFVASLSHPVVFEAAIIMACRAMNENASHSRLEKYKEQAHSGMPSARSKANEILGLVADEKDNFNFGDAISRLEFLSPRHFGTTWGGKVLS